MVNASAEVRGGLTIKFECETLSKNEFPAKRYVISLSRQPPIVERESIAF
jgi:hypothetical protein